MTNHIALYDILRIRDELAATTPAELDPAFRYELINANGLLSALTTPFQAAFGMAAFPSVLEKAAAMVFLLIANHPFRDGNKRIAGAALALFLSRNAYQLHATPAELDAFTTMALHSRLRDTRMLAWLRAHTTPLPNPGASGTPTDVVQ